MPEVKDNNGLDVKLLLKTLSTVTKGDFSVRTPAEQVGLTGKVYDRLNKSIENKECLMKEVGRVSTAVGKKGI